MSVHSDGKDAVMLVRSIEDLIEFPEGLSPHPTESKARIIEIGDVPSAIQGKTMKGVVVEFDDGSTNNVSDMTLEKCKNLSKGRPVNQPENRVIRSDPWIGTRGTKKTRRG